MKGEYEFVKYRPSLSTTKKYDAVFKRRDNGKEKVIHFGGRGYSDFTKHKDEARKDRYIKRHEKRENWNDPLTAGFHSRWVLWNKPDLKLSMLDAIRRMKALGF